ncbi:MAG: PQQ-binding-like beta-propeller repeat protein [Candidatus Eremiobacteraeota bacterium]|nr:PQQ-binding-like beta-propeller repeat protein [Candidatus Eremiobacteraeota bacterium]
MEIPKTTAVPPKTRKPKALKPPATQKGHFESITDSFSKSAKHAAALLDTDKAREILLGKDRIGSERINWVTSIGKESLGIRPSIGADGTVYAGVSLKRLTALKGESGEEKWSHRTRIFCSPPMACPDGTLVFWGGSRAGDYQIYGVDGATGEKKWNIPTDEYGIEEMAVTEDGTVFVAMESSKDLMALDGSSGREKWKAPIEGRTEAVTRGPGGTLFVKQKNNDKILALSEKTGKKKYEFSMETGGFTPVCTPSGNLCVTDTSGNAKAFDSNKGSLLWEAQGPMLGGMYPSLTVGRRGTLLFCPHQQGVKILDEKTGKAKWEFNPGTSATAPPAEGDDGTVYVACHNPALAGSPKMTGVLYALEGETGKKKWELWFDSLPQHVSAGPGNSLFVDDDKGNVYSLICDDAKVAEREKELPAMGREAIIDEGEEINIGGVKLSKNLKSGVSHERSHVHHSP